MDQLTTGQRLAAVERAISKHSDSLEHLHDCMHKMKTKVEGASAAMEAWEKRYQNIKLLAALLIGIAVANGIVSLKSLIEILKAIH